MKNTFCSKLSYYNMFLQSFLNVFHNVFNAHYFNWKWCSLIFYQENKGLQFIILKEKLVEIPFLLILLRRIKKSNTSWFIRIGLCTNCVLGTNAFWNCTIVFIKVISYFYTIVKKWVFNYECLIITITRKPLCNIKIVPLWLMVINALKQWTVLLQLCSHYQTIPLKHT